MNLGNTLVNALGLRKLFPAGTSTTIFPDINVSVDTLDGKETLRIPSGTQPSQVFRLRGKGVQFLDGSGRGDHYVHVNVRVPPALTEEQRALYEQLATIEGEPASELGVFDKVKNFFT